MTDGLRSHIATTSHPGITAKFRTPARPRAHPTTPTRSFLNGLSAYSAIEPPDSVPHPLPRVMHPDAAATTPIHAVPFRNSLLSILCILLSFESPHPAYMSVFYQISEQSRKRHFAHQSMSPLPNPAGIGNYISQGRGSRGARYILSDGWNNIADGGTTFANSLKKAIVPAMRKDAPRSTSTTRPSG